MITEAVSKPSTLQAWFLAFRPKTLTGSIIPVAVGSGIGVFEGGQWHWGWALLALGFAIAIQIATNLFNDAIDFSKGTDTEERLGPERATQKGWLTQSQVLRGAYGALFGAALFGLPLSLHFGWPIAVVVLLSMALTYLYTGGRYPLSYLGIGDPFIFLFFGLIATMASAYFQTGTWSLLACVAGAQLGCLITAIGAFNNLRDIASDRLANKKTLPVRFGIPFGKWEITILLFLPFALSLFWLEAGYFKIALLTMLGFPLAKYIVSMLWTLNPSREYNRLFGLTALLHLGFGCLILIGLWLQSSLVTTTL